MQLPIDIPGAAKRLFRDGLQVSLDLFKVMLPIIVAVKILQELGLIPHLAILLEPFMEAVGLPGEMGLVWATAMLTSLYSAVLVLLSLIQEAPLSAAQMTVLCTMMLVAHSLPVELRIAQKSGARPVFQGVIRIGMAFFLGGVLHGISSRWNLSGDPAHIIVRPEGLRLVKEGSIGVWAVDQAVNFFFIFLIILGLLFFMRVLRFVGLIEGVNRALGYLLRFVGIGPRASAVTVIGLTLGISYGGGLIIQETKSGRIPTKDVFYSLTLMGLCHGLIEDTLLMVMVGGHLLGILWARAVCSFLAVAILVRLCTLLPKNITHRYLWRKS